LLAATSILTGQEHRLQAAVALVYGASFAAAQEKRISTHHSDREGILGCRARARNSIKPQKEAAQYTVLKIHAVMALYAVH